jgi:hypothetical protein
MRVGWPTAPPPLPKRFIDHMRGSLQAGMPAYGLAPFHAKRQSRAAAIHGHVPKPRWASPHDPAYVCQRLRHDPPAGPCRSSLAPVPTMQSAYPRSAIFLPMIVLIFLF